MTAAQMCSLLTGIKAAQVPLMETFLGLDKNLMWFFLPWRAGPLDTMLYSNPIILGLNQNTFQQHILVNKWMFILKQFTMAFFFKGGWEKRISWG